MEPKDSLIAFTKAWDEAMIRNNADEIGSFMSNDWVIVGTEGGVTKKHEFLEWIRSGIVTHHTMNSDQMDVKIYGDTGVIISKGISAGHHNGAPFELYEWSSSVFLFRDGKWSCVSTMLTPALKN